MLYVKYVRESEIKIQKNIYSGDEKSEWKYFHFAFFSDLTQSFSLQITSSALQVKWKVESLNVHINFRIS